jgi:hypothetical protein
LAAGRSDGAAINTGMVQSSRFTVRNTLAK